MKLGIVVVYLVSERNEPLLDLHLSQIEKNTVVPYTIYAGANRLLPRFRAKLEQHPTIKICDCPTTDLRGRDEHAFYLEHLVRAAVEDGATHIATLHVDSFPIRPDWAEELAQRLLGTYAFAAIVRGDYFGSEDWKPLAACIFFARDFYLKYQPTFLLSDKELASPEYERYPRDMEHLAESGFGYGFRAVQFGLEWYRLEQTTRRTEHSVYGHIYGDLIFHLGAAAALDELRHHSLNPKNPNHFVWVSRLYQIKERVRSITPLRWRRFLSPPAQKITMSMYEHVRQQLLDDPETYLDYLRTGKRQLAKHTMI
jgi:hypothetical protein